jgi:signal peptidase II
MEVMKPRWYKKDLFWIVLAACLLIIDQAIKALMIAKEPLIDLKVIRFLLVHNTGASFGMFQGGNALLIWVSIIAIGVFLIYYDQLPKKGMQWGFLACAGVISNLIDRVLRGAVIDFVDLGWWPVFNIADVLIIAGVGMISLHLLREDEQNKKKSKRVKKKA